MSTSSADPKVQDSHTHHENVKDRYRDYPGLGIEHTDAQVTLYYAKPWFDCTWSREQSQASHFIGFGLVGMQQRFFHQCYIQVPGENLPKKIMFPEILHHDVIFKLNKTHIVDTNLGNFGLGCTIKKLKLHISQIKLHAEGRINL